MAKLPALVTALAEVDGRDRATIDNFARVIREAGLIPTGKRGVGASEMDVPAAANLLIGSAIADSAKSAPIEIERFRSLIRHETSETADPGFPFDSLFRATTLGDAIEAMIEDFPHIRDELLDYGDRAYDGNGREFLDSGSFGLMVRLRTYFCEIEVYSTTPEGRRVDLRLTYMIDATKPWSFYGKQDEHRTVIVELDLEIFEALHVALTRPLEKKHRRRTPVT